MYHNNFSLLGVTAPRFKSNLEFDRAEAPLAFHSDSAMPGRDFEETAKQEEARLRVVHPTTEDIPGCMTLLDDFLSCNSAC